jgi:hypothetical protein
MPSGIYHYLSSYKFLNDAQKLTHHKFEFKLDTVRIRKTLSMPRIEPRSLGRTKSISLSALQLVRVRGRLGTSWVPCDFGHQITEYILTAPTIAEKITIQFDQQI